MIKTQVKYGIQPPQMPRHLPAGKILPPDEQAEYTGVSLLNGSFENQTLAEAGFEQVRGRHLTFIRAKCPRLRMSDVRLDVCDLSAADWEEGHIRRAEFVECRLWGADFYKAQFQDVLFHTCNAEHAVYTAATLNLVRFEQCILHGVSFAEADLRGVVFQRCDLTQADLRGAKLRGADLRGSTLEGLLVNASDLSGVIIEPAQAVQIAIRLGIEVRSSAEV
ncbi:MAG TPA: pentapeptide repeat-containing protein [Anaerolineae bacterium]